MSPRTEYDLALSDAAVIYARLDTEGGEAIGYAVTLVAEEGGELRTVPGWARADRSRGIPGAGTRALDEPLGWRSQARSILISTKRLTVGPQASYPQLNG
jgi:hypothetical protein